MWPVICGVPTVRGEPELIEASDNKIGVVSGMFREG